jgi:hypothetical protein
MNAEIVTFQPIEPLARIKQRILAAQERIGRGEADWLEGTLEIAVALLEARAEVGDDNNRFNHWLKFNKLDFYTKDDRAALIHVGADLPLARTVYTEESTMSVRALWGRMRERYRKDKKESGLRNAAKTPNDTEPTSKPADPMRQRPPRSTKRGLIARTIKLGPDTIARIKNTPLDTPQEMDAMIELNRIDQSITERLMDEAAAGSNSVSAVAEVTRIGRKPGPTGKKLIEEFNRRMHSIWRSSSPNAQTGLIEHLMNNMKKE